jgi:hypothetical protein
MPDEQLLSISGPATVLSSDGDALFLWDHCTVEIWWTFVDGSKLVLRHKPLDHSEQVQFIDPAGKALMRIVEIGGVRFPVIQSGGKLEVTGSPLLFKDGGWQAGASLELIVSALLKSLSSQKL